MKKRIFSILAIVVLLVALVVTPVMASPLALMAEGSDPREARTTVTMPEGTTLSDITSISWDYYLINGYAPHVDIILDMGSSTTDALVFEFAYNGATAPQTDGSTEAYGSVTGQWITTFENAEGGDVAVDSTSMGWLSSGPAGGPDIVDGTLAEWVAGGITNGLGVDGDTPVLRLEFEVDSWIKDTTALIDNINVVTGGTTVGMTATVGEDPTPDIVAISVDTSAINFGTVYTGQTSGTETVTVTNEGIAVDVVVCIPESSVFQYLTATPSTFALAVDGAQAVGLQLTIPAEYVPRGEETGTLTFEITAATPE